MSKETKGLLEKMGVAVEMFDAASVERLSCELVDQIRNNIAAYPEGYVKELQAAVDSFDRQRTGELCSQLTAHLRGRGEAYPFEESTTILDTLRRKRYFDLLLQVADALMQTGQDQPKIRRQYAQALLDLGHLGAGLAVLRVLEQDCLKEGDAVELAETRGLMGRAHKQMYMDGAAQGKPGNMLKQHLQEAISDYAGVYEEGEDHLWHGINTVALLERARRDDVSIDKASPQAEKVAKDILQRVKSNKAPELWEYASAGEASIALEDYAQAIDWIVEYTKEDSDADAFEYASTLRQFEEVWGLDDQHKDQAQILHLLRAALLRREGGRVEIENPAQAMATFAELETDKQFEKVLGKDRYKPFRWYRTGLERASGVAQIIDRSGNGQGSGFLVPGQDLHPSIDEKWVVVTNAHVVSEDPAEQAGTPAALPPDEARVRFEAKDPEREYEVNRILFSSPRGKLDCTILSLTEAVDHQDPYPLAKRLPLVGKNQRVYVIGHPRGGRLSYSMDDNLLLDHEKPKVHYRAPTEGGSSGSPVFNQQWDLLALHHAGGMEMKKLNGEAGTYPANEGIFLQSIRSALAEALDGSS